jgi:YHS domain-containing protein
MKTRILYAAGLILLAAVLAAGGCKKSEPGPAPASSGDIVSGVEEAAAVAGEAAAAGGQAVCPVMGGRINKDCYTEYKGKKVYFCCPGCIEKFKASPEKYLGKLPQFN